MCSHESLRVLGVCPAEGNLEVECEGCHTKVLVLVETLPAVWGFHRGPEFVAAVESQGKAAARRVLHDRDRAAVGSTLLNPLNWRKVPALTEAAGEAS